MNQKNKMAEIGAAPWQCIFDALLQAVAAQDGQPGCAMTLLVQHLWQALSPMDKVLLLGNPAVISFLHGQPRTAETLLAHVGQQLMQIKHDCEQAGLSFYWDPEGYGWSAPLLVPEEGVDDHPGRTYVFSRLTYDIVDLLWDAHLFIHQQSSTQTTFSEPGQPFVEKSPNELGLAGLFLKLSPHHP